MNEIRRAVRAATARLMILDFFGALAVVATAAIALVLVARVVQQIFGLQFPWPIIAWSVAGAVALSSVGYAVARRRRELEAARVLDERAGLRETLSTALCVERNPDAWSHVVVEAARQKAVSMRVRDSIPIRAPRLWPAPLCAGVALMIVWMSVPPIDVLGLLAKRNETQRQQTELKTVKAEVRQNQQRLDELLSKVAKEPLDEKQEKDDAEKPAELKRPEDLRRAEIKRLTDVMDQLNDLKQSERQIQLQAAKESMERLRMPAQQGPLDDFYKNLSKADFSKAKQSIEKLQTQLANKELTPEDREKLAKQLENLSKQLEKLAQANKELTKALEQAGLDSKQAEELAKQLAKMDPKAAEEAINKAMEAAKNLSPEQREQLEKQLKAQAKAAQNKQKMSEAMQQMASECKDGSSSSGEGQDGEQGEQQSDKQGQGSQMMAEQLSEMESLQAEADALSNAMSECKSQLKEYSECLGGQCEGNGMGDGSSKIGEWAEGDSDQTGSGSGPAGRGSGPGPDETLADYTTKRHKANVTTGKGPIISRRQVEGESIRGESRVAFESAAEAASQAATEALSDNTQIPREFHDAVKAYFGRLERNAKKASDAPAKPAEPAKPSTQAQDKR